MTISRRSLIKDTGLGAATLAVAPLGQTAFASSRRPVTHQPYLALPANSRNSVFTRQGAGPKYWTVYGWDYPNNHAIPESAWQQNIDWVAATFQPYGYDMCVTNGWIDYTQNTDANGYILSYQDDWTHDWSYWSQYLTARGMSLGVYYNPLWVCKSAVEDSSKHVVGRPDVTIADIVDTGDWFGGTSGSQQLYWVDVTKDGAKEYVQGYVRYFHDMGVPFLRVDFLSWYESGYDENIGGSVGIAHGSANYATAQWNNPFTGFTGFADRNGRGQLILDGDFLVLSGFADDAEKQTAVSLFTMAGSQLAIGDRVDTIGDDAQFFTNTEVLALNTQGLAGKPYFFSGTPYSQDSSSRDTGRWAGQLPDGSWAVGLFNRSDGPGTSTSAWDFASALGLTAPAQVRDLWAHQNLGSLTGLNTALEPHACQLVHVTPTETARRYQAAFAAWGGGELDFAVGVNLLTIARTAQDVGAINLNYVEL